MYGIMGHFTLNLRPKEYFQMAPNMRTAYIELCIYLISKSVTYRPGRPQKKVIVCARDTISQTSREILTYIWSSVYGRNTICFLSWSSVYEGKYIFGRKVHDKL